MTKEEYTALYEEHLDCDSKKRTEEIEKLVVDAATELLTTLNNLHWQFGFDFVNDSEYHPKCGSVRLAEMGPQNIYLHYHDHWQCGGESNCDITIPVKFLDQRNIDTLRVQLRRKQMQAIHAKVSGNIAKIDNLKKENSELAAKLAQLVDDDKADPNGRLVEKWDTDEKKGE